MVVKYGGFFGRKKEEGEKGETRNTRKAEAGRSFTHLLLCCCDCGPDFEFRIHQSPICDGLSLELVWGLDARQLLGGSEAGGTVFTFTR